MFLPLDLRDVDLCLEGILVDLDGLVSSSGRAGGLALLVAMEGRSEGVVSRDTEAGTVAVVPSRALGTGGSGSGGITEPGVWAEVLVASVEVFSKLEDIEAFKVSVILSHFLLIAAPSLFSNWLRSVPELCKGVEGVGSGTGSCRGCVFTAPDWKVIVGGPCATGGPDTAGWW